VQRKHIKLAAQLVSKLLSNQHECFCREMGYNMDDLRSFVEVLTPDDSAKNIIKIVGGLKGEDSGRFINYNGNSLPF
jgi:hypothetical protein